MFRLWLVIGMIEQDYREIFIQIENTLRKESNLSKELFDSRFGDFKTISYKKMSDDEIFWNMICVVFHSGMNASTVEQKLPAIKKYLYDFRKVKEYSQKEIDQILNDPNTIHNKPKIEACIENAKEFYNILNKYGSFAKYLEAFGEHSDVKVIYRIKIDLRKRFRYISKITVYHFLTELGFNVLKPDRVVCRIFSRLGLIDNKNETEQAIDVGRNFALITSNPIRYIDIIFVLYGQMGKKEYFGLEDGICLEENPKCKKCGVINFCKFYHMFSQNLL
ncbi:Methyladenine glycosylase [uncultured archaeon]|nr:Methyladenine glycosylase [uncultured archaeon]